jgi:hypothetical protein
MIKDRTCNIVNLTPHDINIYDKSGKKLLQTVKPAGYIARARERSKPAGTINGIPVVEKTFLDVDGLPVPESKDDCYFVSAITGQALAGSGRNDIIIGGDSVLDGKNNIIGIKSFAVVKSTIGGSKYDDLRKAIRWAWKEYPDPDAFSTAMAGISKEFDI